MTRRVTVIGQIAPIIAPALIGLIGYWIGTADRLGAKLFGFIAAAIVLLGVVPTGRREIVLVVICMAIGYSLSGALRRWSLWQKLMCGLMVAVVVYMGSAFFFAFRVANWELGSRAPFASQLSLATEFIITPTLQDRLKVLIYDNIRERTFMIGYLADIIDATQRVGPLYGKALLYYVRYSVPSVIDPHKDEVLAFGQVENYVHPLLGLPPVDRPNTIVTDGVTDFGLPGALVYALGLLLVLRLGAWLANRFDVRASNLFALLGIAHLALAPELPLSGYLAHLRDLTWIYMAMGVSEYWYTRTTIPPIQYLPGEAVNRHSGNPCS
jgi:hypothetical protein